MAIVTRGHGVDNGAPNDDRPWEPPSIHKKAIPEKYKRNSLPAIHAYFDMEPHLSGPNAKQVEKGMEDQFKSQYKNRKNKFKDEMFVRHGRYKEPEKMRNFPLRGKSLSEWHELLGHMPLADTRSGRAQVYFPTLSSTSRRAIRRVESGSKKFMKRDTYNQMLKLRASQEGLEVRMTDDEIMDKVLGTSRGFKPGRGRKLPNSASSSSVRSYPAPSPSASQAALVRFVEAHNEQVKDILSQLANKNIEIQLPVPLDPNNFMDDASDESDEGNAHEEAVDPEDE
ncbi:hypothetical protein Tco_0833215 [Tanacetum coccineum]